MHCDMSLISEAVRGYLAARLMTQVQGRFMISLEQIPKYQEIEYLKLHTAIL